MPQAALLRNPLFDGLGPEELQEISWKMRPRRFTPGEAICRAGEPGDSLLVIGDGVARVLAGGAGDDSQGIARLRRGDVIGEMSLLTDDPRSATVLAATATTALELARSDFAALIARFPRILLNLNRILSQRLARTSARVAGGTTRGEAVLLLVGESTIALVPHLLASTAAASARPTTSVDARVSAGPALGPLDDLLADHATVVLVADLETPDLWLLLDAADRAVALVGNEGELARLTTSLDTAAAGGRSVDVVALGETPAESRRLSQRAGPRTPVLRAVGSRTSPAAEDVAWLGRHLSRTKLGLALGAGGAKGYAHIGALDVLREAGYTIDFVSGSSIGAIVGSWLALGMGVAEIDETMRRTFCPEVVADVFKLSLTGKSSGLETMTRVLRDSTQDKTFDDTVLPLVVMTVDLNAREPAPVTGGSLWEALTAATAVAGLFPPYERDGQRLVDGLALVPVPTDAVAAAGADVTVSVNIMSRQTLPAWPGEPPAPPVEAPSPGARMLDTLLEVMDLAQLDASEQHAARADVVVTPRFGPGSWRDFHLGDLFLEAGRRAADEQLAALTALANPATPASTP